MHTPERTRQANKGAQSYVHIGCLFPVKLKMGDAALIDHEHVGRCMSGQNTQLVAHTWKSV